MTQIIKNNCQFLIDPTTESAYWWPLYYKEWEQETFAVFDACLNRDQNFIDIGAWIGTTCLYASSLSKKVYAVEADPVALEDMDKNIEINNLSNLITVCGSPISGVNKDVYFGPNNVTAWCFFWNTSSSVIKKERTSEFDLVLPTVTFGQLVKEYEIDNVSLIKIDIEGGEEDIIQDVFNEIDNFSHKPAIYLSFHHPWWQDKDMSRFSACWPKYKYIYHKLKNIHHLDIPDIIAEDGFGSLLFTDVEMEFEF